MYQERLYLFDTTLRDGAQTHGIDFTVTDKKHVIKALDQLGFDYIEAGFPGSNQTDTILFDSLPSPTHARLTAFGMTRRIHNSDPTFQNVLNSKSDAVCLVGKTWDFHVDVALGIRGEENLALIAQSIKAITGKEALFDAEHFFDGYKANSEYALACLQTAYEAGARWIVLCDTNGGTLPHEIRDIVEQVVRVVPGENLGIHTHNDTGNAVANTLEAVRKGIRMVQGTINGLGERCGNANLVSLLPTLIIKLGYTTGITPDKLRNLVTLSRDLDNRLDRASDPHAPYVGRSAFAHKGGLHASGVRKNPLCYEHIDPLSVGNRRLILNSEQSGRANVLAFLQEIGIESESNDPRIMDLVTLIKQRDYEGYAYDKANASLELLVRRSLGQIPEYFSLLRFAVTDERRYNALGKIVTESQAVVKLAIQSQEIHTVSEGNGPVNALDRAIRKALEAFYPLLNTMSLKDYRVRILDANDGSGAITRVFIESQDDQAVSWNTIGVSTNIIDASLEALMDSFVYKLFRERITPADSC